MTFLLTMLMALWIHSSCDCPVLNNRDKTQTIWGVDQKCAKWGYLRVTAACLDCITDARNYITVKFIFLFYLTSSFFEKNVYLLPLILIFIGEDFTSSTFGEWLFLTKIVTKEQLPKMQKCFDRLWALCGQQFHRDMAMRVNNSLLL
jgi:hypothetical protein